MKLLGAGRLKPVFKPKRFTTVVAIMIIGAGVASGIFAAATNQAQKDDFLIGRAQTIADTLAVSDLKSLEGNENDLSTLAYERVKKQLDQVRVNNRDISYIRVFTIADNRIVINVDAQAEGTEFYGLPGTKIPSPSNELRSALIEARPNHDPLLKDYSERWVAGYAPVIDQKTGATIAAVGVFVPANTYYLDIALYALVPLLLAAIPFAGILRDIKLQSKEHEILQLKNQFISIASHELRSPLNGMLWGIQSLQQNDKKLTLTQRELLADMYKSTESSIATVNEILDSSIFERGKGSKLHKDLVDARTIVAQVTSTLNLGAKEKNIEIKVTGEWPNTAFVTANVDALKRAFMNVVSNAIKYSQPGTDVSIYYRLSSNNEHVFAVKDHGIGIPYDEQTKVLSGYYRASNATSMHTNGTGLGLWVSKKVIEEHGGRLWLNSVQDKGTTVFIALPATAVPTKAAKSVG